MESELGLKKMNVKKNLPARILKKIKRKGVKLYCPADESKNPVVQGKEFSYYVFGGSYTNEKFEWICVDCGQAWFSREIAMDCRNRKHIDSFITSYEMGWREKARGSVDLTQLFDYSLLDEEGNLKNQRKPRTPKKSKIPAPDLDSKPTSTPTPIKQPKQTKAMHNPNFLNFCKDIDTLREQNELTFSSFCDCCLKHLNQSNCPYQKGEIFDDTQCNCRKLMFYGYHKHDHLFKRLKNVWKKLEDEVNYYLKCLKDEGK